LAKYRSDWIASWSEGGTEDPVPEGDIWRVVTPKLLHLPCHYNTKDRHVFLHFTIDIDEEHGVELYLKNEKIEKIGAIECRWQEAGWLAAERGTQELHCTSSVIIPGTTIEVPIPEGWVDTTESYREFLASWRNVSFLKKLEQPMPQSSLPAERSIVFFRASLPAEMGLEEYRANLAAGHRMRNQDIFFSGYSGWMLESGASKVMVLMIDTDLFVYQLRSTGRFEDCRALWEWLP
jgi:hypothetical protein